MNETLKDIYHSLKLFYTYNHFCRHISEECLDNPGVRHRARLMIAQTIYFNQESLRKELEEPNENFSRYKVVFVYA